MPNKIVTFRRWEVILAFVVLTLSFTIMGLVLNNQNTKVEKQNKVILHQNKLIQQEIKRNSKAIRLVQASRIEACKQNYKDIQGVINLFVEEEKAEKGKLTKQLTLTVLRYYRAHPMECSFLSTS